jgi:hypothetical protein
LLLIIGCLLIWALYHRIVEIDIYDGGIRVRIHQLVLWYCLEPHMAGFFHQKRSAAKVRTFMIKLPE